MHTIKRLYYSLRLAIISIAIEHEEAAEQRTAERLEKLNRREIDLRIRYSQCTPLRHIITYPASQA